jgi:hypothetical protein
MYNDIFKSPYAEPASFLDKRFIPKTWFDSVFYPFEWAFDGRPGLVSEFGFRDIRIATALSLDALVVLISCHSRIHSRPKEASTGRSHRALIIFVFVAYLLWLGTFSIYRYLLPLELLSGAVIVLAIGRLVPMKAWAAVAGATAALCVATTNFLEWGHRPLEERYIKVTVPPLSSNTLVVVVGGDPISFFIPFLDPNIRWVRVLDGLVRPERDTLLMRRARDLIQAHQGPLLVMKAGASDLETAQTLSQLSLTSAAGECAVLASNLEAERYQLCPISPKLP